MVLIFPAETGEVIVYKIYLYIRLPVTAGGKSFFIRQTG